MLPSARFPLFRALLWIGLICSATSHCHAQMCPDQLLFSFGGFYYYSVKDCATGTPGTQVYVYGELVKTGCDGRQGCLNTVRAHSILTESQIVGDPYDPNKPVVGMAAPEEKPFVYRKVPANAELMTPWARNTISMYGGYPKVVRVDMDGQQRYFKLFRVGLQGNNKPLGFGTEIDLPADSQERIADATLAGYTNGIVRIEFNDGFQKIEFKALYELPETRNATPNGGGNQ